jgi:hypothetical protein
LRYPHIVEFARQGVVPERVDTLILDREVDFVCGGVGCGFFSEEGG